MPKATKKLTAYRRRRNLNISPEPHGSVPGAQKNIFVIQKHAARNLHYDVRLAIDGVLVSWAVPKGIAKSMRIKRLALRTDDHPMEYARFEGVIPHGEYGGGTVMVWDTGTYRNLKSISMEQSLKQGRIAVVLRGSKIHGSYAFIKTKQGWLLFKMKSKVRAQTKKRVQRNRSVLSGRTMQQIAKDVRED